jgi:Mrp family chromosome partitioning ATPase
VLDTPPLGPVSDCALLARWVDGVLMVVAAHRTSRKLLEEALNLLQGASVLGIVFNGDDRAFLRYRRHSYRGYFSGARKRHSDHMKDTAGM